MAGSRFVAEHGFAPARSPSEDLASAVNFHKRVAARRASRDGARKCGSMVSDARLRPPTAPLRGPSFCRCHRIEMAGWSTQPQSCLSKTPASRCPRPRAHRPAPDFRLRGQRPRTRCGRWLVSDGEQGVHDSQAVSMESRATGGRTQKPGSDPHASICHAGRDTEGPG